MRFHRRDLVAPAMVLTSAAALAVAAVPAPATAGARRARVADAPAPGAPGAESYFDLARKDCVGTARNSTSKVWFTVAGGALSDTYWPTVDATNVHDLQYIVTNGTTFDDLQARDMRYTVSPSPSGMSCTVTAESLSHRYRITTTYLTDPEHDAVLMRIRFHGRKGDRLYVRLDPLAGGNGGGGTQNAGPGDASVAAGPDGPELLVGNPHTASNAVNRDYAAPTYEALSASGGFSEASVGYAGSASDGLTMLDGASHALTPYSSAPAGHVVLVGRPRLEGDRPVVLALGFATTSDAALATARSASAAPFAQALKRYEDGWLRYDRSLNRPDGIGAARTTQYFRSVNVVKASEDKTFPGAIAAGLASPWGQSVPAGNLTDGKPTYFGSYREVFARDLYEAFTALLVAGDTDTAQAATRFLFERQQQPDGSMPRNSLTNGRPAPDTGGLQLDETSYPILMAWQSGLAGDGSLYSHHVVPAADFLLAHGPAAGVERWEEQGGYSPSTIAAEIAGLTAASAIAAANDDHSRSRLLQAVADDYARHVEGWTVTTSGSYGSEYFLRLSKTGDPNAAITYGLGNGSISADQRQIVDAGFLELVRLGILSPTDPAVTASLPVIDATIAASTPNGTGFYRYGTNGPGSEDGYGDCFQPSGTTCTTPGAPWAPTGIGTGHLWPVLSGERGEYELAAGQAEAATTRLDAMTGMTSGGYLEPEQAWEDPPLPAAPFGTDPTVASIGFAPGHPAGSASPLTWAQAQYARLALSVAAGHDLVTPAIVSGRYGANGLPGTTPLTVTSPADGANVDSPNVTLTGTSSPGALIDAGSVGATGGPGATASTAADAAGNWKLSLPTGFGSSAMTVTATLGRSTGVARLHVTNVALPGTPVLTVSDPVGDDNGPGTYAYPTAADFQTGAFDLTGLKVSQTADSVYVQVGIRNLAATFGNAFGAQLLDLYVHSPAAASTSTAAPYASRNYTIAPADAWSERVEAQGFAPVSWVDAAGASRGTPQLIADGASGTATLIFPRAEFGDVGSGWVFTAVLAGQDGYSSDAARGFASTPQAYLFGVCAAGTSSPICSVNPASVPKVLDTITPPGISQATELDPTRGPVVLQGVTVP